MGKEIENPYLDEMADEIIENQMKLAEITSKYQEKYSQKITNEKIYDFMFYNKMHIRNNINEKNYWIHCPNITDEDYKTHMQHFKHPEKQTTGSTASKLPDNQENREKFKQIGFSVVLRDSNSEDKSEAKSPQNNHGTQPQIPPEKPSESNKPETSINKELQVFLAKINDNFERLNEFLPSIHVSIMQLSQKLTESNDNLMQKEETVPISYDDIININNSETTKISVRVNSTLFTKLKVYVNNKYHIEFNDARIIETAIIELLYRDKVE
jgi:hypothetical protein